MKSSGVLELTVMQMRHVVVRTSEKVPIDVVMARPNQQGGI